MGLSPRLPRPHRLAVSVTLAALGALNGSAWAVSLDIRPQPLAQALTDLGRQANVQVLFDAAQVRGMRAPAVRGDLTARQALDRLLGGTGIRYELEGDRVTLLASTRTANDTTALPATTIATTTQDEPEGFVANSSQAGSKTGAPLLETPQSISVITRQQMDVQNVQSVTQALRYVPGVKTETYGVDPKGYDWLYIRGFNAQSTSDYRDGLRQLNNSYSFFRSEPYGLDSIEVVRGPSSSLFGLGDAGGIINRVSKLPTAAGVHEVELGYGSHDRTQARFDIGDRLTDDGTLLYRVVGVVRKSDTQFEYSDGHEVPDDRFYIAPSLTWAPDDDTSLTVLADFLKDTNGGTLSAYTPYYQHVDEDVLLGDHSFNHSYQRQFTLGYRFRHRFNDNVEFRQNLRFGQVDFVLNNLLGQGTVASVAPRLGLPAAQTAALVNGPLANSVVRQPRRFDEHLNALTVDNQLQFDFATASLQHTLLTGIDYARTESDVKRYQTPLTTANLGTLLPLLLNPANPVYGVNVGRPNAVAVDQNQTQDQIGYYLQDQIHLDDHWIVTVGGRYDEVRTSTTNHLTGSDSLAKDQDFTGRVGLTYLTDFGLAPYVSYAESFVPNSGTDIRGATFDPSEARQWEAGIKYQPNDGLLLTLAAFDVTKTNVLTNLLVNGIPSGFSEATGEVRSKGIEAEAKARLNANWDLLASYTYTDTEITKSNNGDKGNEFSNVPRHMASGWLNYTFRDGALRGLSLGGGLRYVGSFYGDNSNVYKIDPHTLFDAGASYPINRNVTVSLTGQNLGNKHYVGTCDGTTSCYPGETRTLLGSVKYSW